MKIPEAVNTRFFRTGLLVVLILGITYVLLSLVVFEKNEMLIFIDRFFYGWLGLYEDLASLFLNFFDISFTIENHQIIKGGEVVYEFAPIFLMRKLLLGLLAFTWLFPVKLKHKFYGTFILLALHIFFTSFDMILMGSLIPFKPAKDSSAYLIARTPAVLVMISYLVYWLSRYREIIFQSLRKLKINTQGIEERLTQIIVIFYVYGILNNFILGWFDFIPWINFLFVSSQKILSILGYEADVYLNYLLGERGSIYMEKGCLGFGTMALFAAIVYLTSNRKKLVWIYIVGGLIFLNFVNILRFVFLFIHLQKNNGYALAIEVHDMYNLILFGVVFVLWIIWFELFVFKRYESKS
jgi:exosortase/archaeosortase family protein